MSTEKLTFYCSDYCPFAQRSHIALGEKETDPYNPQLYEYIEVHLQNKTLPSNGDFVKVSEPGTVPAAKHNGQHFWESLQLNEYINDVYPQNPLLPSDPVGRFNVRLFIERNSKVVAALYKLLMTNPDGAADEFTNILKSLSSDLTRFGGSGPYALGTQFTLADIALIPFIERALVLLPHYRNYTFPKTAEYERLHQWIEASFNRPSVKVTQRDRQPRSVAVHPFAAIKRTEYLQEVYEPYANDVTAESKPILATAPPGVKTIDIQALKDAKFNKGKVVLKDPPQPTTFDNSVLPWKYTDILPYVGQLIDTSKPIPKLYTPYTIKNITLKNRIVVSPMCQYSSADGFLNDWHLVHLGSSAIGGASLVIQEATAVSPNGRITANCPGIWKDEHIQQSKRLVEFLHSQNAVAGIQLAHAGRKASTPPPFLTYPPSGPVTYEDQGGWPKDVVGPSSIPYADGWLTPNELTKDDIQHYINEWKAATRRVVQAGYDFLEIHGAHGYLISSWLSPLSNTRTDEYGGSFENRIRFLLEIVQAVRSEWSTEKPLSVRISCTEYADEKGGWSNEDTLKLVDYLIKSDVDIIDCSTGGNIVGVTMHPLANYQVQYSANVKKQYGNKITTMTVGKIFTAQQANDILDRDEADLIAIGRAFLINPQWAVQGAREFKVPIALAPQYQWSTPIVPVGSRRAPPTSK